MVRYRPTGGDANRRTDRRAQLAKRDKPGSALMMVVLLFAAIGAAGTVIWLFMFNAPLQQITMAPPPAADQPPPVQSAQQVLQAEQAQTAAARLVPVPDSERDFANILATAFANYNPDAWGLSKRAERQKRAQEICAAFPSPHVAQWVGIVGTLAASDSEQTIQSIWLDVKAAAANSKPKNTHAPAPPPILIMANPPGLPVPDKMNPGDTVTFSGDFVQDQTGQTCVQEANDTADSAMQSPAFLMNLSEVTEAQ